MNQLHSNQDRMHKKRQLGVPIIGGGAPGAGSATPTATRETVPVAPSSTPVAAAPSTRALPDPVTLRTSSPSCFARRSAISSPRLCCYCAASLDRTIFISRRSTLQKGEGIRSVGEGNVKKGQCEGAR